MGMARCYSITSSARAVPRLIALSCATLASTRRFNSVVAESRRLVVCLIFVPEALDQLPSV